MLRCVRWVCRETLQTPMYIYIYIITVSSLVAYTYIMSVRCTARSEIICSNIYTAQDDMDGEPLSDEEVLATQPHPATADIPDSAEDLLAELDMEELPKDDKLQDPDAELDQLLQSQAKEPQDQNGQSQELEGLIESLSSSKDLDAELDQLIQPMSAKEPQDDKLQELQGLMKSLSSSQDPDAELDQLLAQSQAKDDKLQELQGLLEGLSSSQDPHAELDQLLAQSQAKEPQEARLQELEGPVSLSSMPDPDAELDQFLAQSKDTQDDKLQELERLISLGSQLSIPKPAAQKDLDPLFHSAQESQDDQLQELQGLINLAMGPPEELQEAPKSDDQATIEILDEIGTKDNQEDLDKSQGAEGRTDAELMDELKQMLHSQFSRSMTTDGIAHNTTPASHSMCGDADLAHLLQDNNLLEFDTGSDELKETVGSTPTRPKASGELGDASGQTLDPLDALEADLAKIIDADREGEVEADHTKQYDNPSVRDEHTAEEFIDADIMDVDDEGTAEPTAESAEKLRALIRAKKAAAKEESLVPVEEMQKQVQQSMGLIASNGPPINPQEIWWRIQELAVQAEEEKTCTRDAPTTATCLQCTLNPPMCDTCLSKPQSSKPQEARGYIYIYIYIVCRARNHSCRPPEYVWKPCASPIESYEHPINIHSNIWFGNTLQLHKACPICSQTIIELHIDIVTGIQMLIKPWTVELDSTIRTLQTHHTN